MCHPQYLYTCWNNSKISISVWSFNIAIKTIMFNPLSGLPSRNDPKMMFPPPLLYVSYLNKTFKTISCKNGCLHDLIILRKYIRNYPLTKIILMPTLLQKNWVFVTTSNFLIPKSLQPDGVNLSYFKLIWFDLTEFIDWII